MTSDLIRDLFARSLDNMYLRQMADATVLPSQIDAYRLAMSTDSFVVQPLFFPGGNVGSLAVHGTVNDVAMSGAKPLWLTAAFILEEGLKMDTLQRVVDSMASAARQANVWIVAGDTKVVEHGHGDGMYINTTGIGIIPQHITIAPDRGTPGDVVLVSGTLGDHGIAVLSKREGLTFETDILSDSAALNGMVAKLLEAVPNVHCLRDATRGGLAAALNELATSSGVGIEINENAIPIRKSVAAACEMMGFDPLSVANEGKLITFVPAEDADEALRVLQDHPLGRDATQIGTLTAEHPGLVLARTSIGGRRVIDLPLGELLPRIC